MTKPDFRETAEQHFDDMLALRRDFHQYPELGFQETRTSGIVAQQLADLGLEVQRGLGKTGVVGLLVGARPGPTLLLRFDMDALPIQEENDLPFKSVNPGVMHACGHDGHTAMGLTLAKIFAGHQEQMAGHAQIHVSAGRRGAGRCFCNDCRWGTG